MMTVDNLHRQAKTTADDIFNHSMMMICKEFDVERGTPAARKLAVELAPVLAAIIKSTTDDLRTMLEHQRGELLSEREYRNRDSEF